MNLGINIAAGAGNITTTNLVGDVRHANPIITDVMMAEFLSKLEALMDEYKINKIDIAWDHFRPTNRETTDSFNRTFRQTVDLAHMNSRTAEEFGKEVVEILKEFRKKEG